MMLGFLKESIHLVRYTILIMYRSMVPRKEEDLNPYFTENVTSVYMVLSFLYTTVYGESVTDSRSMKYLSRYYHQTGYVPYKAHQRIVHILSEEKPFQAILEWFKDIDNVPEGRLMYFLATRDRFNEFASMKNIRLYAVS